MAGRRPGHTGDNVFQEREKKSSLQVKSGVGGPYLIKHDTICAPIEWTLYELFQTGQTRTNKVKENAWKVFNSTNCMDPQYCNYLCNYNTNP